MSYDLDLSRALTTLVASTAGVTEVYPSGPLGRSVILNLINLAADDETDDAKVALTRDGAGALTVTVTIGVDAAHPVPTTLRAVANSIRAHLVNLEPWETAPIIDVRVSHINTAFSVSG